MDLVTAGSFLLPAAVAMVGASYAWFARRRYERAMAAHPRPHGGD